MVFLQNLPLLLLLKLILFDLFYILNRFPSKYIISKMIILIISIMLIFVTFNTIIGIFYSYHGFGINKSVYTLIAYLSVIPAI